MDDLKQMDWFRSGDIERSVKKCRQIFDSQIFSTGIAGSHLFEASLTLLLINLSDLLQKARIDGRRIAFVEDVDIGEGKDVTDLIAAARNAACHISSPIHKIDAGKFTLNVIAGRNPNAFRVNGVSYGSDYADDVAVYYGQIRLYIGRHLLRALIEVSHVYADHVG